MNLNASKLNYDLDFFLHYSDCLKLKCLKVINYSSNIYYCYIQILKQVMLHTKIDQNKLVDIHTF